MLKFQIKLHDIKILLVALLSIVDITCIYTQQRAELSVGLISPNLLTSSDVVIRSHQVHVDLIDLQKMIVTEDETYTILSDKEEYALLAFHYNKTNKIKSLSAVIYNAKGEVIKKIKKKDFRDYSANEESTLYSDSRILAYNHKIKDYPITIESAVTYENQNTGFIQDWQPIPKYDCAVESSEMIVTYAEGLQPQILEHNLSDKITKETSTGSIKYSLKDYPSVTHEYLAPSIKSTTPYVSFKLDEFYLEGVKGQALDWRSFGNWYNQKLLRGRSDLTPDIKEELATLINDIDSPVEKAKRIYQYVQKRSRYVNVSLGIGGWQPHPAQEVHDVGYGDCKALTNYTMALMNEAGIRSHYVIIDSGEDHEPFEEDYTTMQGNHVILCLPDLDTRDTVWLECTSQNLPFGYVHSGIENRNALLITDDGGILKPTTSHNATDNVIETFSVVQLTDLGNAQIQIRTTNKGLFLEDFFSINTLHDDDLLELYHKQYAEIPGVNLANISIALYEDALSYSEHIDMSIERYASKRDNALILMPNILNRLSFVPRRERHRQLPFKVPHSYTLRDTTTYYLTPNMALASNIQEEKISSPFGTYSCQLTAHRDDQLVYTRALRVNQGLYPAKQYNDYVAFLKKIKNLDHNNILITTEKN